MSETSSDSTSPCPFAYCWTHLLHKPIFKWENVTTKFAIPIRGQTPLLETSLSLPKIQPHWLGIVWYRVDMRDNSWSKIGSTAVVCQNKQLVERGISEESCQPRTLAISLHPIVFCNSPSLPKVEFLWAECSCWGSWVLILGCVLSTSNAITSFYQSSQFSI